MPITKAVVSHHVCPLPEPTSLLRWGYLAGTEWTCDDCGKVYVLTDTGMASPSWEEVPQESGEGVAE